MSANRCGLWVLAMITLSPGALGIAGQAKAQNPAQPDHGGLDPNVVAAWTKAGAVIGWLAPDRFGCVLFTAARPANPVAIPSFQFAAKNVPQPGGLAALPAPNVPFGLDFRFTNVTDASLKDFAGFAQLHTLNLGACREIKGGGLKDIAGLQRLEVLNLGGTLISDASLRDVAGLGRLHNLSLYTTQVTNAGLRELAAMQQLKTLDLFSTKVTDPGLKLLAGLAQLQVLYLGSNKLTDAGLKDLSGLRLQVLALNQTQVTDVGLKDLEPLRLLKELDLNNTRVTAAAVAALEKVLPNCKIASLK